MSIRGQKDTGSITPGAAAVVEALPACVLDKDKIKHHRRWSDWQKDAMNKMEFMKMNDTEHKLSYIKSTTRPKLTDFWEKEARLRWKNAENQLAWNQFTHTSRMEENWQRDYRGGDLKAAINMLLSELVEVMKLRQVGKYSSRHKGDPGDPKCAKCTYQHSG